MNRVMNRSALKGRLYELIDIADDKHLEAILVLLEKDTSSETIYDQETMTMLHERQQRYHQGKSNTYTLEETLAYVRSPRK
jgi:hypothetical protein